MYTVRQILIHYSTYSIVTNNCKRQNNGIGWNLLKNKYQIIMGLLLVKGEKDRGRVLMLLVTSQKNTVDMFKPF